MSRTTQDAASLFREALAWSDTSGRQFSYDTRVALREQIAEQFVSRLAAAGAEATASERDTESGPAFPAVFRNSKGRETTGFCGESVPPNCDAHYRGISVRDYFAAKAIQGLMAAGDDAPYSFGNIDGDAEVAYKIADAMLKARQA